MSFNGKGTSVTIVLMDSDFNGGPQKTTVVEPLDKLDEPQLPSFDTLDGSGSDDQAQPQQPVVTSAFSPDEPATVQTPSKSRHQGFLTSRWTISKRWTIVLAVITVLLIGAGVATAYIAQPKNQGGVSKVKRVGPPKPTTVASNLTGLTVDPSVNTRPVTGVMIENSEDARPQSGLDQAGVVFEAIAEGGITRFLALFQDGTPDYIGPVRSARPYYVQWCMGFDCALAHAGGSPEALQNIKDWGTKDLNDSTSAFWRISSRYAPHNLYTSMAKLNEYEASKNYGAASYTPLARKKDAASKTPNASSIDFNISSYTFNAHFDYDVASDSYKRSQAGAPHVVVNGAGAEVQLQPKVVVAIITSYGIASDNHSQYGVVGSGEAYVFQDGTVTKGTWHKADTKAALSFTNEAGLPLGINAGQTWVTALSGADRMSYK